MEGFICPICQTELESAPILRKHWQSAHSGGAGGSSGGDQEGSEKVLTGIKGWFSRAKTRIKSSDISNRQVDYDEATGEEFSGDDLVRKDHWEPDEATNVCREQACNIEVEGLLNRRHHCRRCGLSFCSKHCNFQMRLSRAAQPAPEGGFWCRVCENCFYNREYFTQTMGVARKRTSKFRELRRENTAYLELETNKLGNRFAKLIEVISSEEYGSEGFAGLRKAVRKAVEQTVVPWKNDVDVTNCPQCQKVFSYLSRRHHCRLCGDIMCNKTECSELIKIGEIEKLLRQHLRGTSMGSPMSMRDFKSFGRGAEIEGSGKSNTNSPKEYNKDIEIRICKTCKHLLFRKYNKRLALKCADPELLSVYEQMRRVRASIEETLPKFNAGLLTIREAKDENDISQEDKTKLFFLRKQLRGLFDEYLILSKNLLALKRPESMPLPSSSGQAGDAGHLPPPRDDRQTLIRGIKRSADMFLQEKMLTLQMIPKDLFVAKKKEQVALAVPEKSHSAPTSPSLSRSPKIRPVSPSRNNNNRKGKNPVLSASQHQKQHEQGKLGADGAMGTASKTPQSPKQSSNEHSMSDGAANAVKAPLTGEHKKTFSLSDNFIPNHPYQRRSSESSLRYSSTSLGYRGWDQGGAEGAVARDSDKDTDSSIIGSTTSSHTDDMSLFANISAPSKRHRRQGTGGGKFGSARTVFFEQRGILEGYLEEAKRLNRTDEIEMLERSIHDIDLEIEGSRHKD
eukprot:Nk52_evm18s2531 gene=Nk52_evmTU18s2531